MTAAISSSVIVGGEKGRKKVRIVSRVMGILAQRRLLADIKLELLWNIGDVIEHLYFSRCEREKLNAYTVS